MVRTHYAASAALLAVLVGPLGCGGPPPPVAPPAPPPPTAAPALVVAEPTPGAPDLSPAPEPADVVGTVRWKNPMATFTTAAQGAGAPAQVVDAGARVAVEAILHEAMRGMVNAHELAPLVALDAPVDAVMTLDPSQKKRDVVMAMSIGLTSLEGAKRAAEGVAPLIEIAPSMWKIGGKEPGREGACAIAASVGSAPARLVCGRKDKDIVALGPYLARTLPTSPSTDSDMHGELRFAPIDARYGEMLRQILPSLPALAKNQAAIGEPTFDRALVEGATGLADELGAIATDLDKITFDVGVSSTAGVTAQGSLVLRNNHSWLAGTLAERADRAGPPPAIFWRAPKDSDAAFWGRAADPSRYSAILRVLRTLGEGALAKMKVGTPADRKALVDLIQLPLSKDTTTVQASGHIDPKRPSAKPTAQEAFDGMLSPWIGWNLMGFDEGPAAITKTIKNMVGVYNRATLLAPLKKEMKQDAKMLPTVKTVAAPPQLGAGGLDVEIKSSGIESPFPPRGDGPRGKAETLSVALHLLVMADGKQTWVALGMNRDELVKRLLQVRLGAPESGTLSARAGLEPLKSGAIMTGGFFTLAPILKAAAASADWIGPMANKPPPPEVQRALAVIGTVPNHGETPMFLTTRTTAASPIHADIAIRLPKGAIDDLTSLAIGLAKLKP